MNREEMINWLRENASTEPLSDGSLRFVTVLPVGCGWFLSDDGLLVYANQLNRHDILADDVFTFVFPNKHVLIDPPTSKSEFITEEEAITRSTTKKEPFMSAKHMLDIAAHNIDDRASERDVGEERSMLATVNAFNAMYGTELTEEQGWSFMVMLKLARAKGGQFRADDYIDGASYFGLAGECAGKSRD